MEIAHILESFNQVSPLPIDALNAALAHQSEITPALLDLIKKVVNNPKAVDLNEKDSLIALFLLAQFRERQAFPYIIQLASLPSKWVEEFLGDAITENLTSFIVSTYDGNLAAIKSLIENKNAHILCRSAASQSLLGLFALQHLSREEIVEYYRTLIRADSLKTESSDYITSIAWDIVRLYPQELYEDLVKLLDQGLIDPLMFGGKEGIDALLQENMEECLQENIYNDAFLQPMTTMPHEVDWLYKVDESDESYYKPPKISMYEGDELPKDRITLKPGRNDGCPCESGKKYKKCCLGIYEFFFTTQKNPRGEISQR